jgi:hypothetical protein
MGRREAESGNSSGRHRSRWQRWSAKKQSWGGDGDGQREGDSGVLVMVRAPGSRCRGSTGVGVGGAEIGGGDGVAPRS